MTPVSPDASSSPKPSPGVREAAEVMGATIASDRRTRGIRPGERQHDPIHNLTCRQADDAAQYQIDGLVAELASLRVPTPPAPADVVPVPRDLLERVSETLLAVAADWGDPQDAADAAALRALLDGAS